MFEHFYTCPYCWETVSLMLDSSIPSQQYIEDCEVCCNPIQFAIEFRAGELHSFSAISIEQ
ncbi:CPXCG motif-containing cysteine-rich protein [Hanstruepera neustonica]|uniref:CPXCG motif-containing cysteine-rich protein n=1 Tax=Hanstruepera neustonica TaxID=1445657 RepID=A0A2K1E0P8_9FLAO|nr:CPXCG motif-containing cysteine-rich protein [Hanstruepera neustonica]PNQ73860.1 CPXCG motif-containing cysteine-rich protein [Hanstruepera neustonica]